MKGLTIGEIAAQAEVHIETLRYYERRGLVERPPRSASNYRRYPEDAVRRVRFIKRAQELGFSLKDIKDLLSLRAAPEAWCHKPRHNFVLQSIGGSLRLPLLQNGACPFPCTPLLSVLMLVTQTDREVLTMVPGFRIMAVSM
jgi:DNA-binding transcriptional MerR regulator